MFEKVCKCCGCWFVSKAQNTQYCNECGYIIKLEKARIYKKNTYQKHKDYMSVYMADKRKTDPKYKQKKEKVKKFCICCGFEIPIKKQKYCDMCGIIADSVHRRIKSEKRKWI